MSLAALPPGHDTCLKKLVTVSVAGRKPEKLQASSPLLVRSWGPRRRRSVQVERRSRGGGVSDGGDRDERQKWGGRGGAPGEAGSVMEETEMRGGRGLSLYRVQPAEGARSPPRSPSPDLSAPLLPAAQSRPRPPGGPSPPSAPRPAPGGPNPPRGPAPRWPLPSLRPRPQAAPPPHRRPSRGRGRAAPRCSRCWPGALQSRRRACGSDPGACRTAQPPGAASPASLCSEGRPPTAQLSAPGPALPGARSSLPAVPWPCPPPSSPCRARSTR